MENKNQINPLTHNECEKNEYIINDMIVYKTYQYKKQKIDNKIIINDFYQMFDCIGKGSFWKVFLVQRNYIEGEYEDKNFYVFKEGVLSKGDKNSILSYEMNRGDNLEVITKFDQIDINSNLDKEFEEYRLGVKEYKILKLLNHKNIARLYECIRDTELDKIVLIMEYADLGEFMIANEYEGYYEYNSKLLNFLIKECKEELYQKETAISEFEENYKINFTNDYNFLILSSKFIFKQLAQALDYLHNKKISHLDTKPHNISMRSSDKNIKLLDFSNARKLNSEEDKIIFYGGTLAFNAPEVMTSEYINPFKIDVYALGATLYVYLFNELDFDLDLEMSLGFKNNKNLEFLKKVDLDLFNLLVNMMEKDPEKRVCIREVLEHPFFK